MSSLKPNAKFECGQAVSLSAADLQGLTLLYQPLIDPASFSLYLILAALLPATVYEHQLLLQLTGHSLPQVLDKRHRLEAVGLLDVYELEEKTVYQLKKPLSAEVFFADGVMSAFLYVKLGTKDFSILKRQLLASRNGQEGARTTKRFDEVFDLRMLTRTPQDLTTASPTTPQSGIELNAHFDCETLEALLLKAGIDKAAVTSDLLNTLNELSFLYKLDVHELARLAFDGMDPTGAVDVGRVRSLARRHFQLLSKGRSVEAVIKSTEAAVLSSVPEKVDTGRDERLAVVDFLEQNPFEFLRFKAGGKPPVPADMRLVEWLYLDQKMPSGVVNVLVDYVLDYTDGQLPKALIEKIAGQWQRQNVTTTGAAMEKVAKSFEKRHAYAQKQAQPVKKSSPVAEVIPDWFGKDHAQPAMSEAEAAAAKKRMEAVRNAFLEENR